MPGHRRWRGGRRPSSPALLTHPTNFAAASLVVGLCAALDAAATRRRRPALAVLGIAVALGAVLVGVRFGGRAVALRIDGSVESARAAGDIHLLRAPRLEVGADGRRYRVRPGLLGTVPIVGLLAAGLLALARLRSAPAARYVLAAGAVALAVLAAPTAMPLGVLVTPFHLWRLLWLAPFGDFLPAVSLRAALLLFRSPELSRELGVSGSVRRRALAAEALDVSAPPARRLQALRAAGVRFAVECDGGAALAEVARTGTALRLRAHFGALSLSELARPRGG